MKRGQQQSNLASTQYFREKNLMPPTKINTSYQTIPPPARAITTTVTAPTHPPNCTLMEADVGLVMVDDAGAGLLTGVSVMLDGGLTNRTPVAFSHEISEG